MHSALAYNGPGTISRLFSPDTISLTAKANYGHRDQLLGNPQRKQRNCDAPSAAQATVRCGVARTAGQMPYARDAREPSRP